MARIGQFVWATVPFVEGDGRAKVRPVLILAKAKTPNGEIAYLAAAKYSSTQKVRGDVEVVLTQAEALEVGMDKEGVLRFSRDSLVCFTDSNIRSEGEHFSRLSGSKKESIRRAAKAVRVDL